MSQCEQLINEIQEIRAKNNRNWMALLRLAFKHAPMEARSIMTNITECDSEILRLTKLLSDTKEGLGDH